MTRESFRSRLSAGDIVYFVEGVTPLPESPLTVKIGSVWPNQGHRLYPQVRVWSDIYDEGYGSCKTKSPRELFTHEEVSEAISSRDPSLGIDTDPRELIIDPITNRDLVAVLGGVTMERMIEDEIRRPGDPEYV